MTDEKQVPAVSQALVDYLTGIFPDRCPTVGMTDQEIWSVSGAAQVVRKLRQLHEVQSQRKLEGRTEA